MNKRKLGRTDLRVSELALDATHLPAGKDESSAFALLDAYHTGGGSFIQSDGFSSPSRGSEDLVGRWHTASGVKRDSLVLASRLHVRRPAHGGTVAFANHIHESLEASLRRLRTQYLDLLVCDWTDELAPVDDLLEAADRPIRAGLVRHVVAGGFPPWRVTDSIHRSAVRSYARFEAIQADFSLLTRAHSEPETFAMCREHRLGFIASSPLANGQLSRRPLSLRELINVDRNWRLEGTDTQAGEAVRTALAEIADRRLASPGQIALAWVLRNPHVTSALIAASTPAELRQLIRTSEIILTNEDTFALARATAGRPLLTIR